MCGVEVVAGVMNTPLTDSAACRPDISQLDCADFIVHCIEQCWAEQPEHRPDFKTIRLRLKPMQQGL